MWMSKPLRQCASMHTRDYSSAIKKAEIKSKANRKQEGEPTTSTPAGPSAQTQPPCQPNMRFPRCISCGSNNTYFDDCNLKLCNGFGQCLHQGFQATCNGCGKSFPGVFPTLHFNPSLAESPIADMVHHSTKDSSQKGVFPKPPLSASGSSATTAVLHAKVHFLASRYLASQLQVAALAKLHANLHALDSSDPHAQDAAFDMIELVYDSDIPPIICVDHEDGKSAAAVDSDSSKYAEIKTDIRALVSLYAACKGAEFMKEQRFREILVEHGVLGADMLAWQYRE